MDRNLLWQYAIVILLILAAIARIIWSLSKKNRRKGGGCCGCSLADLCHDFRPQSPRSRKHPDKPASDSCKCHHTT